MTYDALIIGGGPAGATAALLLAKGGWSVALVERKAFPRRKVCGEFISATSLPLLRELGIAETALERAGPDVRRVGLFAQDMVLTADMPKPRGSTPLWGRALGREHLDLMLLEAAGRAGADIWQPCTATKLQRSGKGYVCSIAAKSARSALVARIVIVAHGSWEANVLPERNVNARRPSDLLAFKAHFRGCDLAPDLMPLLLFPGGYGGMVHSDGGRTSLSCCIRRDALKRCRQREHYTRAGEAVLRHIKSSCLGAREALKRCSLDGTWLSAGPINPGIRKHYAEGIFFVGNAAAEAHPIVAEGISMAIQSAGLLARHLSARQNDVLALCRLSEIGEAYGREWKVSFAPRVRAAATFAHLGMRPRIASLYLPVLKQFPGILTVGATLSGKAAQLAHAG